MNKSKFQLFIADVAVEYATTQFHYMKASGRGKQHRAGRQLWERYAQAVVENWEACRPTPRLEIVAQQPYNTVDQLRRSVGVSKLLHVWGGLPFSADHPMRKPRPAQPAAYFARAFHDLLEHVDGGLGFDTIDELRAAERSRRHYEPALWPVVWTDDVAIGCYKSYFGVWPECQYPVIVAPRWPELSRHLRAHERRVHQYCVEEGAYGL